MSNYRTATCFILLVFSLVFVSNISSPVQAQSVTPTVRMDPPQIDTLPIGSNFTLYIWVDNASGIEGAQVQFTYDSTSLNVTSVVEGPFLQPIQTAITQLGSKAISDTLSEVDYSAAGTTGTVVTGSGVLLNVTFTVLAETASTLHLKSFIGGAQYSGTYFLDINYNMIMPNLVGAAYGSPVTLQISSSLITTGDIVILNGTLTGVASNTITDIGIIYKSLSGGDWANLTTVPVDSSHAYSYPWTSNSQGAYEFEAVYTLGNKTYASPIQEVIVEPSLHGYGNYVIYGSVAIVAFIIAVNIILGIRSRRKTEHIPV